MWSNNRIELQLRPEQPVRMLGSGPMPFRLVLVPLPGLHGHPHRETEQLGLRDGPTALGELGGTVTIDREF